MRIFVLRLEIGPEIDAANGWVVGPRPLADGNDVDVVDDDDVITAAAAAASATGFSNVDDDGAVGAERRNPVFDVDVDEGRDDDVDDEGVFRGVVTFPFI